MKLERFILDATAGNRTLWRTKKDPRVLWIDIEPELEIKPDLVMDCTKTDFPDKHFNFIVFDPPHGYGRTVGRHQYALRNREDGKKWKDYRKSKGWKEWARCDKGIPRYYGYDKYKSKTELMTFCYNAQKEFHRILCDNGILFLKWNEHIVSLYKLLSLMSNWVLMIKLETKAKSQTMGDSQTFWLLFMKDLDKKRVKETLERFMKVSEEQK